MSTTAETNFENDVLTVTRLYNASRADVFDAWMNAEKMNQWYGPNGTIGVKSTIEARVGGLYAHEMTFESGKTHTSEGTIVEYDPPDVFAYKSSGPGQGMEMIIRIEFIKQGNDTLVRLTHKGISEQAAQFVTPAWAGAFDKLADFLQG